jgi:hypothetical protein
VELRVIVIGAEKLLRFYPHELFIVGLSTSTVGGSLDLRLKVPL